MCVSNSRIQRSIVLVPSMQAALHESASKKENDLEKPLFESQRLCSRSHFFNQPLRSTYTATISGHHIALSQLSTEIFFFSLFLYGPTNQPINQTAEGSCRCVRASLSLLGVEVVEQDGPLLALLAPVAHHDAGAVDHFSGVAFAVKHTCIPRLELAQHFN